MKKVSVGTAKRSGVRKLKIPKALREQVWLRTCGRVYEAKCVIGWCNNVMTVHDFHCGHNVPESRGGATALHNLLPICARCNLSMGNMHTIDEWTTFGLGSSNASPLTACKSQLAVSRKRHWLACVLPFVAMRSSKPR